MVRRNATGSGDYPADRTSGTLVANTTNTYANDTGLSADTTYYYALWTWDTDGNKWCDNKINITGTTTAGPGNVAPTITGEIPASGSTDVTYTTSGVQLNATVDDANDDTLTATWYSNSSGSWVSFATNSSIDTSGGAVNIIQTNSNFSSREVKYWWSVNVTDSSLWTNTTYWFTIGYTESKIDNTGSYSSAGYLLIRVDYNNSGTWIEEEDTINETTPRTINSGSNLKLDTIFNGNVNTSVNLTSGTGHYRIYVAFRDPYGNVLQNDDSTYMNATWEFNYTASGPDDTFSLNRSTWHVGSIDLGDNATTSNINLTNTGDVNIDVQIKGANATNSTYDFTWNLTSTQTHNNFTLQYNKTGGGGTWTEITTAYAAFVTSLPPSGTNWQTFDLRIFMANTTDKLYNMSFDITFRSVAS